MNYDDPVKIIEPGRFVARRHFFAGALQTIPDQRVATLFASSTMELADACCALFPGIDIRDLLRILQYRPRFFKWAGSDLFLIRNHRGERDVMLLETNSCPSGQKYVSGQMTQLHETGYGFLVENVFVPEIAKEPNGILAVLYDKNGIEASGYATAMANRLQEPVYLVALQHPDADRFLRHGKDSLEIATASGWQPARGTWRYVTNRPWSRLPLRGGPPMINPVIACIAGGRNKAAAAFAYDQFNRKHSPYGLKINTPNTIVNVAQNQVPVHIATFGGRAVVKIPYSNAGQGIFPITNEAELSDFSAMKLPYERLIVQELIGANGWANGAAQIGTTQDAKGDVYSADLRLMVGATAGGYRPVAAYGRRARLPLPKNLRNDGSSNDFLVTNLSYWDDGHWKSDKNRVLVLDAANMAYIGWQWPELVKGYIQTCFAMIAIDELACQLMALPDQEMLNALSEISEDPTFLNEIALANQKFRSPVPA